MHIPKNNLNCCIKDKSCTETRHGICPNHDRHGFYAEIQTMLGTVWKGRRKNLKSNP